MGEGAARARRPHTLSLLSFARSRPGQRAFSLSLSPCSPRRAAPRCAARSYFLLLARRFRADPGDHTARPLFRASLWYLPVFLFLFVFHASSWHAIDAPEPAPAMATATAGDAAGAAEGAARARARGSSYGAAIEHAVASWRAAGRELCAHVLFVDAVVGGRQAGAIRALFGSGDDGGAGGGGAVPPPASAREGALVVTSGAAAAASELDAGGVSAAAACPVVVGARAGESAKRGVQAAAAAVGATLARSEVRE